MNRRIITIVFVCCAFSTGAAQEQRIEMFGYFESQYTGFALRRDYVQLHSNKLRLDIAKDISDKVRFGANYDFITYHGETAFNLLDYIPGAAVSEAAAELKEQGYYSLQFADRNYLDNAYLKLTFKSFDITAGRQQVSPGTGYVWNPTDIYNIKDVFDPTYEQPGHNAIRIDIPFAPRYTLAVLYSPERTFSASTKLIRLKCGEGHFDYSFVYGERNRTIVDFLTGSQNEEGRRLAGIDLAGELFGAGIWFEAAHNSMEITRDYKEAVIGADYTFENGLYLLAELYHNEQGKTAASKYTLNTWMKFYTTEIKTINQNQTFIFFQYPATDLLNIGSSIIYSFDNSLAFVPQIAYNLTENLDISLFGNIYAGKEGKTYSTLQGNGGFIRARYYF